MKSCSIKFHDLNIFLLGFVSTSLQFTLLSPAATPSYFSPDIFPFPSFIILLKIPRFRCCLHIIHTVSESMSHKYKVQLTSVSIFWFSPGIEFSLRLPKVYAGDNKVIYFTVSERLTLWYLLPSTCGPKRFSISFISKYVFPVPHYDSFVSLLPFSARISSIMSYSSVTSFSS